VPIYNLRATTCRHFLRLKNFHLPRLPPFLFRAFLRWFSRHFLARGVFYLRQTLRAFLLHVSRHFLVRSLLSFPAIFIALVFRLVFQTFARRYFYLRQTWRATYYKFPTILLARSL
jgi:hypothetical protein